MFLCRIPKTTLILVCRHSRAGGNPDLDSSEVLFEDCRNRKLLDFRLRGNDGSQTFKFSQAVYLRSSES